MVSSVVISVAITSLVWLGVVLIVTSNYASIVRRLMDSNREVMRNTWAERTALEGKSVAAGDLVQASAHAASLVERHKEAQRSAALSTDDHLLGL